MIPQSRQFLARAQRIILGYDTGWRCFGLALGRSGKPPFLIPPDVESAVNEYRTIFVEFCAFLTGYSVTALEGTGLPDTYQQLLEQVLGHSLMQQFHELSHKVVALSEPASREEEMRRSVLPSPIFWPVVSNLISLWYMGSWAQLPDEWYAATGMPKPGPNDAGRTHVPTEAAYTEQLSYRTAGAHTPGAKPTGFGSWSIPPIFKRLE